MRINKRDFILKLQNKTIMATRKEAKENMCIAIYIYIYIYIYYFYITINKNAKINIIFGY
jgi:hypothetical protein